MKDLFKKYNTEKDTVDDIVSERYLMLNICRNQKDLATPASIKSSNKNDIQQFSNNIPIFDNDINFTICELLNGLNSIF